MSFKCLGHNFPQLNDYDVYERFSEDTLVMLDIITIVTPLRMGDIYQYNDVVIRHSIKIEPLQTFDSSITMT